MRFSRGNWEKPPKEVSETISDPRKYFYGGLACDVWVYSWVMMHTPRPEWLVDMEQTLHNDNPLYQMITDEIPEFTPQGDEYLVIMKDRGLSLEAYNVTGEPIITSPDFVWAITDTLESAKAVMKADQRLQKELLDMIGDEDALIERN